MKINYCFLLMALLMSTSAWAQDYRLQNNEVVLNDVISFKTGSDELLPESQAALLAIKTYLEDKPAITKLRIEGHTDNTGNDMVQQKLSEKRAAAVCQRLVKMGIDCQRLLPVGFGSTKPITDNSTAEGKSKNQRISFINAGMRGKNIGGMPVDGGGVIAGNACL